MSTIRGEVEGRRERLIALVLALLSATKAAPITQEQIVRELMIDALASSPKGPRKTRAYEGGDTAVRQKFERDKASIRELGFQIETVALDDGGTGYWVDPASAYAPTIYFTDDEARVVQLALRLYGFGSTGAFSVFGEGPAGDGGLEFSNYYTPVLRALNLRRALVFDYRSAANKSRTVEPLAIEVFRGTPYLVARVRGTDEVKGYRFSRISSMPAVLLEPFEVDDATRDIARSWRPEYSKSPTPIDVVVVTSENYRDLLLREFPDAVVASKKGSRVEVGITFDNQWSALRFVLEAAERVTLKSPKSLKADLSLWLKDVNRAHDRDGAALKFSGPATNDVLGQTLQLLHAVYLSDDGLRVSELSARFSLDPAHVRLIMDRLVSLQPLGGNYGYLAHVIKECDDWDEEATDDSIYRADFGDAGSDSDEPSPLMWRDLFELNIALREAARLYTDPAVVSAIEKIENTIRAFVHVDSATNEPLLAEVLAAVEHHEQIKIEYTSGVDESSQLRSIEPREIRVLNGRTMVRAYCTSRQGWRTFRLDRINSVVAKSPAGVGRPADPVANWLTQVGDEGDEVVAFVEPFRRWLFEPLPNAQWCVLDDGRYAVKFHVADPRFLDHLMLQAGAGAFIVTAKYRRAGHDLAQRIAARL